MKNLSIFLILLWVFSAPLTQAQTARVIVESQDSAGWTYRGAVSSVKTPFSESEASLAEAFSNYTAPAFPMTHFAAYRGADSHQIHWTQGTPRQAFRVYVQRSADGESWTEIGMIKGEAGLKERIVGDFGTFVHR